MVHGKMIKVKSCPGHNFFAFQDESMVFVCKSAAANTLCIQIYDPITFNLIAGAPTQFNHTCKQAKFSRDGQYLIVMSSTAYTMYVYDVATWTLQSSFVVGTNGTTSGMARPKLDSGDNYIATWGSGTHTPTSALLLRHTNCCYGTQFDNSCTFDFV